MTPQSSARGSRNGNAKPANSVPLRNIDCRVTMSGAVPSALAGRKTRIKPPRRKKAVSRTSSRGEWPGLLRRRLAIWLAASYIPWSESTREFMKRASWWTSRTSSYSPHQWEVSRPTPTHFMISAATCGNGAWIGSTSKKKPAPNAGAAGATQTRHSMDIGPPNATRVHQESTYGRAAASAVSSLRSLSQLLLRQRPSPPLQISQSPLLHRLRRKMPPS